MRGTYRWQQGRRKRARTKKEEQVEVRGERNGKGWEEEKSGEKGRKDKWRKKEIEEELREVDEKTKGREDKEQGKG